MNAQEQTPQLTQKELNITKKRLLAGELFYNKCFTSKTLYYAKEFYHPSGEHCGYSIIKKGEGLLSISPYCITKIENGVVFVWHTHCEVEHQFNLCDLVFIADETTEKTEKPKEIEIISQPQITTQKEVKKDTSKPKPQLSLF